MTYQAPPLGEGLGSIRGRAVLTETTDTGAVARLPLPTEAITVAGEAKGRGVLPTLAN